MDWLNKENGGTQSGADKLQAKVDALTKEMKQKGIPPPTPPYFFFLKLKNFEPWAVEDLRS